MSGGSLTPPVDGFTAAAILVLAIIAVYVLLGVLIVQMNRENDAVREEKRRAVESLHARVVYGPPDEPSSDPIVRRPVSSPNVPVLKDAKGRPLRPRGRPRKDNGG